LSPLKDSALINSILELIDSGKTLGYDTSHDVLIIKMAEGNAVTQKNAINSLPEKLLYRTVEVTDRTWFEAENFSEDPKDIEVTEDSSYQITENTDLEESHGTSLTITGVQTNTTVEECIKNFGDSDEISILDKNGNEVNDDTKVGTGFEVQKKADGVVIQVAVIIIKGDTDGTGTIDVLDMEAIQKSILGISKLVGAYKSAAVISDGETDISVLDMEAVQKDILGIAKIK
jgi:hypothetical protein